MRERERKRVEERERGKRRDEGREAKSKREKCSLREREITIKSNRKRGREWRLPGLLYADDLVLCGDSGSEEDLRVMVGRFVEMCNIRGLRVNASKSKVVVLNREEGLECKVHVDRICLEDVSEFKYFGCVLDESGTDRAGFNRKVESRRRLAGAIRSLVNARDLQLECTRVLHETLLVPFLMYSSETMLWNE